MIVINKTAALQQRRRRRTMSILMAGE